MPGPMWIYLIPSVAMLLLAIPLMLRRIPPNPIYGLRLPATLLFDHPTPAALVRFLRGTHDVDHATAVTPAARRHHDDDPIAIVAMACRFPGGVRSPDDLWRLLDGGTDAIASFPTDRGWQLDDIYDPDPTARGKTYVRDGGFLDDVAGFDPLVFGISAREAVAIDPQQRLLLETAWEALERAGIDPTALHETSTGVYIGAGHADYQHLVPSAAEAEDGYALLGNAPSVASGRMHRSSCAYGSRSGRKR